MKEKGRKEKV